MTCKFPITKYEGDYNPHWTREWTNIDGDAVYFTSPRDIIVEEDFPWDGRFGIRSNFPPLAVPTDDWGAFSLVGFLQIGVIGNPEVHKICGEVSYQRNDITSFVEAGEKINRYRQSLETDLNGYVYCIPGTGKGDVVKTISLTLVVTNWNRVEVYFLRGVRGGVKSRLPGMRTFYGKQKISKFFSDLATLWNKSKSCCM